MLCHHTRTHNTVDVIHSISANELLVLSNPFTEAHLQIEDEQNTVANQLSEDDLLVWSSSSKCKSHYGGKQAAFLKCFFAFFCHRLHWQPSS